MTERCLDLCALDDLPMGASRGFSLATRPPVDIFVVRTATGAFGYHNSCPHTGAPLDWVPDRFLNLDGDFIQCATHHALFAIENGFCVSGPCRGQSLRAVPVTISGGRVLATLDESGDQ